MRHALKGHPAQRPENDPSAERPPVRVGRARVALGLAALASLPQLSNGTLTGVSINTDNATVLLPGDITRLVSANIGVGANSAIKDAQGRGALTGLTSVDPQSSLSLGTNLTLTGSSFTASGNVSVSGATLASAGPVTQ